MTATTTANTFAVELATEALADWHAHDAVRAMGRVAEARVPGDAPPWSPLE